MRIEALRVGNIVGLQYETGQHIDAAEVIYVGSTCFQLSNGLLYFRPGGRCIQGPFGGQIVPSLTDSQSWIKN
jgi:hypothetical protein